MHSALKNFIKSMAMKGYYSAGIGEGIDHSTGKQNYLGVTFEIKKLPDIAFARKVEIEALNEFLQYINLEERIQDYVAEYPYPLKFVSIAFICRNPDGLCSVANFEEEICYDINNPEKPIGPTIEVHRESYAEAVQILKQQTESIQIAL